MLPPIAEDNSASQLILALAHGDPALLPDKVSDTKVDWLLDTGMGPALWESLQPGSQKISAGSTELLQRATSSARMRDMERRAAFVDLLKGFGTAAEEVTLLKGIAVSTQYYEKSWLRPMQDLDILVPASLAPVLTEFMLDSGYRQTATQQPQYFRAHHHLMPFNKRGTDVWIEVHTGLFSQASGLVTKGPLEIGSLLKRRRSINFDGQPCKTLSREQELIYLAVHWAEEFKVIGGMAALLDVIAMLEAQATPIDWDHIMRWEAPTTITVPLRVLLTYLQSRKLITIPCEVLDGLRAPISNTALNLMHRIVDIWLASGDPPGPLMSLSNLSVVWNTLLHSGPSATGLIRLPWNLMFPQNHTDQTKLAFQMERIGSISKRRQRSI